MQQSLSIQHLLDELEKLPGIGPKSAQRVAYHLLNASSEEANKLADAIRNVKEKVTFCERCFNYAEADLCDICARGRATSQRSSAPTSSRGSTMCSAARSRRYRG